MATSSQIKEWARELGFDQAGVCSARPAPHPEFYDQWLAKGYHGTMGYLQRHVQLKANPQSLLPGAKTIVAVALNYYQANEPEAGKPRIAAYALGRDYHKVLKAKLQELAQKVEDASPDTKTRACVDSAPIFERDYANLAGLGWFGKNTMLINSQRGSWFFIGLLLTTLDLEPDEPAVGGCGTCRKCIEACPTGAIVLEDDRWQVDARRCISYLTIEHEGDIDPVLAAKAGDWTFGCDICQEVCPFNQPRDSQPLRAQPTQEPDFLRRKDWPELEQLAQIDEEDWHRLTAGSPTRRTGIQGLRRNAKINLENSKASFSTKRSREI